MRAVPLAKPLSDQAFPMMPTAPFTGSMDNTGKKKAAMTDDFFRVAGMGVEPMAFGL